MSRRVPSRRRLADDVGAFRMAAASLTAAVAAIGLAAGRPVAGQAPTPQRIAVAESPLVPGVSSATALAQLRATAQDVDARLASGDLRNRSSEADPLVTGRMHERLAQYYRGVPVFGADTTRQVNTFGQTVSVFGVSYPDIAIDVTPAVTSDEARALVALSGGPGAVLRRDPVLLVLPLRGSYRLAWMGPVSSLVDGLTYRTFIDAVTGAPLLSYNDTWAQAPQSDIGSGVGLSGDVLAISDERLGDGGFRAVDLVRPGGDTTYDMKGDVRRSFSISTGQTPVSPADIATSADGSWRGAVASVHAYTAMTMDYYRLRFGRAGLDNRHLTARCFVNVARPDDALTLGATAPFSSFYNRAFYGGDGDVFFGAGSLTAGGAVNFRNFGGGLDVVAHELSHGVTQFSSDLVYQFESGALNESFSDMMGAAVKFMWQTLGRGPAQADWVEGADVGNGTPLRSFSDPHSLGAPDHYSLKLVTVLANDGGGVHTNANIVNHMYYLAIMGGINRVSQLAVQGVGFANRDQIEKVIYRAFTLMLPANATFAVARAATIQAARDLFGADSPAAIAITQAWVAVGVT
jgi:bacillolysin